MFGFFASVARFCNVAIQVLTAVAAFSTAMIAIMGESWHRPSLVH